MPMPWGLFQMMALGWAWGSNLFLMLLYEWQLIEHWVIWYFEVYPNSEYPQHSGERYKTNGPLVLVCDMVCPCTKRKARFIANSSSCTTTELSKLLTSCLTAVKNHVIRYCEKVYERSGKNLFWSIKNSGEVLNKLKSRGFRATSLSTYDFSTLYTTLPII